MKKNLSRNFLNSKYLFIPILIVLIILQQFCVFIRFKICAKFWSNFTHGSDEHKARKSTKQIIFLFAQFLFAASEKRRVQFHQPVWTMCKFSSKTVFLNRCAEKIFQVCQQILKLDSIFFYTWMFRQTVERLRNTDAEFWIKNAILLP